MKKTILLLLTLTLILGVFASCNKRYLYIDDETEDISVSDEPAETTSEVNESTSPTTTDISQDTLNITSDTLEEWAETQSPSYVESYTIEKIDGQYYMVFNSYEVDPTYNAGWIFERFAPNFNSTKEYLQTLVNKTFTLDDLVYMVRNFSKNENGIPIFDPTDFYIPLFPEEWKKSTNIDTPPVTFMDGQKIYFCAEKGDNGFMYAELMTQATFERSLNSETGELELIQNAQREIRVKTEPFSNGHRTEYTVYVTEDNHYCKYSITVSNEELLTQDDLLSLGFVKYE